MFLFDGRSIHETMDTTKIRIGILGGSGYGGSELLRILLFHPNAEVVLVTANEQAGKSVGEVHRNLYGLTDLTFTALSENLDELNGLDCVFFALPHGQAMSVVPELPALVKAIDLSGDFRLRDKAEFEDRKSTRLNSSHSQISYAVFCLKKKTTTT